MEKLDPKKDGRTPDVVSENMEKLRELFPEAFTEGSDEDGPRWKVDFDALKEIIGEYGEKGAERYSFTWHGKSRARLIAQTPSTGTLRPCPEESVNWDTTKNLFIEGDNLEVLKLLQKSYHKKVKMIYIDPPYNTGNDFIYPDKFADNLDTYLRYTGQIDDEGFRVSTNAETGGRYHTNWLNMMYPRLKLARNLLRDDGVIFISIDDTECSNLRKLLDEVLGEENFVANIIWQKKYAKQNDSKGFSISHDHVLLYARSINTWSPTEMPRTDEQLKHYKNPDNHPLGRWQSVVYTCNKTSDERPNLYYPITHPKTGVQVWPDKSRVWYCDKEQHAKNEQEGRVWWGLDGEKDKPRLKSFLAEVKGGIVPDTLWLRDEVGDTQDSKRRIMQLFDGRPLFDTPKPVRLVERMIQVATGNDGGIVLDFFAGSGSTGEAVMKAAGNNRFIMVQLPEPVSDSQYSTIAEIGRERLRRCGNELRSQAQPSQGEDNTLGARAVHDFGFRAFRLDSSNIEPWDAKLDNVEQALLDSIDNIKTDRSENDVLYELLLKYGLDLAVPIETRTVTDKKVYVIGGGALIVCLADGIDAKLAEGIVSIRDDIQPEVIRVVCKDSGFKDDVAKTNVMQVLKQAGIEDVKSL